MFLQVRANDAKRICWRDLYRSVFLVQHARAALFMSATHTASGDSRRGTVIAASCMALPYLQSASNSFYKTRSGVLKGFLRQFTRLALLLSARHLTLSPHLYGSNLSRFPAHTTFRALHTAFPKHYSTQESSEVLFVSMILECPYTGEDDNTLCL